MPVTARGSAYLAGIGGIGTSALAQWLVSEGWSVRGTDHARSEITDALVRAGLTVDIAERPALPEAVTRVVYSDAILPGHPVRVAARTRGIPEISYPELLGELTARKHTVAISGSHGKSTTTALVGLILERAGQDPTVVVGTRVPQWMRAGIGNYRRGSSSVAVVEADEYRSHFLTLKPAVAVVTSLDHDHVDAFPTVADYAAAFRKFLARVPPSGTVVLARNDQRVLVLRDAVTAGNTIVTAALGADADVVASRPRVGGRKQVFDLQVRGVSWGKFEMLVPGEHVVADAVTAVAATLPFGVTADDARGALREFRGTWRRFELVGSVNGAPVISDYAHHPTELRALHDAARQWYPGKRLLVAFQPHQRARTRAFREQFIEALARFDAVIIAEIYDVAGREEEGDQTTTQTWVEPLRRARREVVYASDLDKVAAQIHARVRPSDVVLVVGAGDIDSVARKLAGGSRTIR